MPRIAVADLETFYSREFSLTKLTTESYVRSPQFQAIGLGVKIDNYPTDWIAGDAKVRSSLAKVDWSDTFIVCQNTAFDAAILAWHYGVKPKGWFDILGMSRALFPHEKSHSLKAQAERMGIGMKGTEVENALGKRYEGFTPEELARYGEYCKNDVELTHALFHKYMAMGFPTKELKLIDLTLRMFVEPVLTLDAGHLTSHLREVREKKQALLEAVRDNMLEGADPEAIHAVFSEGLDGIKKLLMSNDKFAKELQRLGVEPPTKVSPTTGKTAWAFAKTDEAFKALEEHDSEDVQALVAARLGNKTTIEESRTETLIDYAARGSFPIALRYYGAATGRWSAESSAKVNMQNLPRTSPIKAGIRAPEGWVICGADLSNIELRLGLWLAAQEDKLDLVRSGSDLYKDFVAGVYHIAVEEVTKQQRQVGKVCQLSLIYGTGPAKLREALRIMGGVRMDLEEVKPLVAMYRGTYGGVVNAWREGDQALQAIANDQRMEMFRGTVVVEGRKGIRLPSGVHIQYPSLRRLLNPDTGKGEWVFDSKYGIERAYGSKVFQGVTQAVARCIMGVGLLRIQKFAPVRLTIHDSAYWLARREEADASLAMGVKALTDPVSFCPGLPLAAEGAWGVSLADC